MAYIKYHNMKNIIRELQVWEFFTETENGEVSIVTEKECKSPKRTKIWKELQQGLNSEVYHSVGYQVKDFDPLD